MLDRWMAGILSLQLAVSATPAAAMEWLSDSDLDDHCSALREDPEDRDGRPCIAFLQGFLAGISVSDALPPEEALSEASTSESYAQRAARTRVGNRLRRLDAGNPPRYCVGDDVTFMTLLERLSAYFDDRPGGLDIASHRTVHDALVHSFPCGDQ